MHTYIHTYTHTYTAGGRCDSVVIASRHEQGSGDPPLPRCCQDVLTDVNGTVVTDVDAAGVRVFFVVYRTPDVPMSLLYLHPRSLSALSGARAHALPRAQAHSHTMHAH